MDQCCSLLWTTCIAVYHHIFYTHSNKNSFKLRCVKWHLFHCCLFFPKESSTVYIDDDAVAAALSLHFELIYDICFLMYVCVCVFHVIDALSDYCQKLSQLLI